MFQKIIGRASHGNIESIQFIHPNLSVVVSIYVATAIFYRNNIGFQMNLLCSGIYCTVNYLGDNNFHYHHDSFTNRFTKQQQQCIYDVINHYNDDINRIFKFYYGV